MQLAQFTYYVGPKSKDFTYGKMYTIFSDDSVDFFVIRNDNGMRKPSMNVQLKGNFIVWWKYPQYLRKKKLEKLNSL